MTIGRPQFHDRIHPPLQIGTVLDKRAVLEPVASFADSNGAKQNPFHERREDVVAGFDGILDIAKLMGQAQLLL